MQEGTALHIVQHWEWWGFDLKYVKDCFDAYAYAYTSDLILLLWLHFVPHNVHLLCAEHTVVKMKPDLRKALKH